MPNWVITRIYITGPEDKIKEFEDRVIRLGEEEEVFSFNRINKRPEELDNTQSPPPKSKKPYQGKNWRLRRSRTATMQPQRCVKIWSLDSATTTGTTGITGTGELNGTAQSPSTAKRTRC